MNITKEMIDAFYEAHDKSLELQPRERHQAIYDGLSAAVAAMPAPAVKVKPLEWQQKLNTYRGSERREQWRAKTPWGDLTIWHYQFDFDEVKRGPKFTVGAHGTPFEPNGIEYDTLEAAKSAAQADYSARIMSAIEPAGVGVETPQPSIHKRCCQNRWSIDHSAGRPILMLDGCSVIESEDAEYLLRLIKNDQAKNREASTPAALKDPLKERLKAGTVHYARQESDRS